MNRFFLVGLLTGFTLAGWSQTTIPGGTVSGTWTATESPYLVEGSIMVPSDSTLTVEPGVTIAFTGHYKLLIMGRLLAEGTTADSILFTGGDESTGWYGIRFDQTVATLDSSRLAYCRLQWGKALGSGNDEYGGALFFNGYSKARISHCIIEESTATYGGGIGLKESQPVIEDCTIRNNTAQYGGGLYILNAGPVLTGNTIASNEATEGGGGGMLIWLGSPEITGNTITNNKANAGGGIYCTDLGTEPVISANTISGNQARGYNGGGIYLDAGSTGTIIGNLIMNNSAALNGGGIVCFSNSAPPAITNNILIKNSAQNGGGIECYPESNPEISNNLIVRNSASTLGGGMELFSGGLFTNNTIAWNYAGTNGGVFACHNGADPVFRNCILYNDTANYPHQYRAPDIFLEDEDSDPDFYYCDVSNGKSGIDPNGNFFTGIWFNTIDSVPAFRNTSSWYDPVVDTIVLYWSLTEGSPCLDAGDPDGEYPPVDLAGHPRVQNGRIDMGAIEGSVPSGIETILMANDIRIYPNPFSRTAIICFPDGTRGGRLDIFSMNGRILKTIRPESDRIVLDRDGMAAGIYLYVYRSTGRSLSTGRLIVTD